MAKIKGLLANGNEVIDEHKKQDKIVNLVGPFSNILEILGFDLEDQQLRGTPLRMARMFVNELLSGCYDSEPEITVFNNTKKYDELITLGPIKIKSMCSHHMVPFIGSCYIGYIPNKKVVGISKFSRIVNWFARRLQIQEELTKQIADYIDTKLKPKGFAVYIEATHMCMVVRGVEEGFDSKMKTSDLRGCLLSDPCARKEFFDLIRK